MSERDVQLSEQIEARKRATWRTIEARADARESARRASRVVVFALAVVAVGFVASRYRPTEPHRTDLPSQPKSVTLQDTKRIAIVRSGSGGRLIERVCAGDERHAVDFVDDGEMLALLREAGLPATLIRIGTEVRVAFHEVPANAPPGNGRSLPVDPTEATQNF